MRKASLVEESHRVLPARVRPSQRLRSPAAIRRMQPATINPPLTAEGRPPLKAKSMRMSPIHAIPLRGDSRRIRTGARRIQATPEATRAINPARSSWAACAEPSRMPMTPKIRKATPSSPKMTATTTALLGIPWTYPPRSPFDRWLSGKCPGWAVARLAKASAGGGLAARGGDSVVVELEEVVGCGHESPLAADRAAASA
jgi:hypothetical protein